MGTVRQMSNVKDALAKADNNTLVILVDVLNDWAGLYTSCQPPAA